jgi:hypothetical protein
MSGRRNAVSTHVAHDTEITDTLENAGFTFVPNLNFLRLDPCLAAEL